jgi:hypothetical protein
MNGQNEQNDYQQQFMSFEEQLERAAKMNKVYYFGPDTKYGTRDTFEIITPSISKTINQAFRSLGLEYNPCRNNGRWTQVKHLS